MNELFNQKFALHFLSKSIANQSGAILIIISNKQFIDYFISAIEYYRRNLFTFQLDLLQLGCGRVRRSIVN